MDVPTDLLRELDNFIAGHYNGRGLISSATEMGAACGVVASEWFDRRPSRATLYGLDRVAAISWAERYGKHVGAFYLSEREVE